jgi:ABC-type branched-subunit amino acid transport system substrate-binding protein
MHIVLKDPETGQEQGILCLERKAQTAIVIYSDADKLELLVQIAKAQKVPQIFLIVPSDRADELIDQGWHVAEEHMLMVRPGNGR